MNTSSHVHLSSDQDPLWRKLSPLVLVVFFEFFAMGIPLPALASQVHDVLGFGALVVGLVIGSQSWATLATRHIAGTRSDQYGPRDAATKGLIISALAGMLYTLSLSVSSAGASLAILLIGRVVLGVGESLVVTGALAWGITLAGRERSGVVMSWVGVAMYGAIAVGAPLGATLQGAFGFAGMSLAAVAAPLFGLLALSFARFVPPVGGARLPFYKVARLIWLPGAGLSLGAVGFGAISAYSVLFFQGRNWSHAAWAVSAFGLAYVFSRLVLGGFPDRFGGRRVAMVSSLVTVAGQLGMWSAASGGVAIAFAALTGLGFAMIFPSFGVEALKRVPPQNRGAALGAYSACFDLTLGVGVPMLGVLVDFAGVRAAFGAGAVAALTAFMIALSLNRNEKGGFA